MPMKKGKGFLEDLKSFGISAAKDVGRELIPIAKDYAISAAKSALTKKAEGKGLYARGSGFTLTPAQGRALVAGKGIQLKPSMMGGEYEMEMTPVMEKKMMRAFAKGKGMRVGAHNLKGVKKGGFVVPLLMTAARIAAPIIIEKLAEAGIKKLGGGVGKSKPKAEPKAEAEKIIEKAIKARKERAEAPRQHGQLTPEDQALVASLPKQGKGKKGGYIGQMPNLGAFGRIGRGQEGMGLFAGGAMDVIQSGSPYQSTDSPAMSPFIPTRNPFGMYVPI